MSLIKNLQFLSKINETLSNWSIHGMVRLAKFEQNWTKIVDFSLMVHFWVSFIFYASVSKNHMIAIFTTHYLLRSGSTM